MASTRSRSTRGRQAAPTEYRSGVTEGMRTAGARHLKTMLSMLACQKITAKDFCILCHECMEANMPGGNFGTYAVAPGNQTGRYQQHLDRVLPTGPNLYYASMPVHERMTPTTASYDMPFNAIWQSLHKELVQNTDILTQLDTGNTQITDVRAYHDHPLVKRSDEAGIPKPVPVAVYFDAVRFTAPLAGRMDNVIGLWIINLGLRLRISPCPPQKYHLHVRSPFDPPDWIT